MRDGGPAEGAGRVGGAVLSQRPQAGFAEDVVAGVTHVRAEVHVQAHGADVAFPVPRRHLLIAAAAAAGWAPWRSLGWEGKGQGSNTLFFSWLLKPNTTSGNLDYLARIHSNTEPQ